MEAQFDIVIPFRDTSTRARASLACVLHALDDAPDSVGSIIVVHNNCDDLQCLTVSRMERLPSRENIVHIAVSQANVSLARNRGAEESTAPYVIFIDADTIPSPTALRQAMLAASPQVFACGAERRFLPLSESTGTIQRIVIAREWDQLNSLSNSWPQPGLGNNEPFERQPDRSTFVANFGVVPRLVFADVGGFCTEYTGWGVEDTDLMRRLLGRLDFVSLATSTVWHIDHLVSPYKWIEHWDNNWRRYIQSSSDHGYFDFANMFRHDHVCCADPEVIVPPIPKNQRRPSSKITLPVDWHASLEIFLHLCEERANVAAVLATGSATRSQEPRDLDLVVIKYGGPTRFYYRDPKLDIHELSLETLRQELRHPERMPDSWMWMLGKYGNGITLFERIDIGQLLDYWITRYLTRSRGHLLSFHLGRCVYQSQQTVLTACAEALRSAIVLVSLAEDLLPRGWHPPCFDDEAANRTVIAISDYLQQPTVTEDALLSVLGPVVSRAMNRLKSESECVSAYYPVSGLGLRALRKLGYVCGSLKLRAHS